MNRLSGKRAHTALCIAIGFLAAAALVSGGCSGSQPDADATAQESTSDPLRAGVRVRAERVRHARLEGQDEVSGLVRAFHAATITAETASRVLGREVERGDRVEEGQVLYRLDGSRLRLEVERSEATLRSAETDLQHAGRELERGLKLIERDAISEQRRDDLQYAVTSAENALALARVARDTARRNLRDATVRAPFAGVVEDTPVDAGDFVAAGAPVARLVELSRVRLRAGVTAGQAARLTVGATAKAYFAELGGQALPAELKSIGLVADPASGTYDVEFWLENPGGRLRDGMVASIALPDSESAPQALVPRTALLRREGRLSVFVVDGEGDSAEAHSRPVKVGRSGGDWVEVLEGVTENEQVVVDGHFALSDGAAVRVELSQSHVGQNGQAP